MAAKKEAVEARGVRVRYVGDGTYLPGTPAIDHTAADRDEADRLVATGLYEIDDETVEEGAPA